MPELPDIVRYVASLDRLLKGQAIAGVRVRSPFVLRTFEPAIEQIIGHEVRGFSRRGKRIVWELNDGPFLVFHLMIAGRFHWRKPGYGGRSKADLLAIDFADGVMTLTEVSAQKRAGVWLVASRDEVDALDPGGLDVLNSSQAAFAEALSATNNTLKRALTDPRRFDGIGNAYSDEILHAARLSPLRRTQQLSAEEVLRLWQAARQTLSAWIDRLAAERPDRFPEKVTAFHPQMAVHGKFGQACPVCGAPVQRIRYASNECNYCARCQTEGKVLSDRSLARLLKDDWPATIEELEDPTTNNDRQG
ncbi:Fpg/Nei family DNA glycosylase [Botrimarina hoheduenensis]|uniref:Formamidopyrimidine-DNA glycosylase n=1 Tax=Botrimarina hoheduenensis TaxID=2528000 RepID=A0A5C5VYA7_9BACT|nr:DNA-formamidopyrimidine glycosylase family protein [Botrimarina hoheduenensis]TWT42933.1 Formamidopyrimidine-DNA glycosylase [Botrimarina hoheduenensis]